jgi:HTH-type transcriptional regulator/antitoxin HigA
MITNKTDNYNPNFAVHPGETLQETLEALGMSQADLARRISRPEKTISEIISGSNSITPETAIQFERALGVSASFWNNLEKNYQEINARIKSKEKIQQEAEYAKTFPYKEMTKLNWIDEAGTAEDKAEKLLYYFGVNSLRVMDNVMPIAYRKHAGKSVSKEALAAWVRKGEIDGGKIETQPFNEDKLKMNISKFKQFTHLKLNEFINQLQADLADCGISLVITPPLHNTYVCGSTRWLTPQKALVQLSLRGRYADIMWFTFYHEIGHILLHGKRDQFLDIEEDESAKELEANKFAADQLIPDRLFNAFLMTGSLTIDSIKKFAERLGVHPGIVVGQLQHKKIMGFNQFHDLRIKYEI